MIGAICLARSEEGNVWIRRVRRVNVRPVLTEEVHISNIRDNPLQESHLMDRKGEILCGAPICAGHPRKGHGALILKCTQG